MMSVKVLIIVRLQTGMRAKPPTNGSFHARGLARVTAVAGEVYCNAFLKSVPFPFQEIGK